MSLAKFFAILASIALTSLVLSCGVLYYAARQQAFEEGRQSVQSAAQSTARSVGNLIALLNQSLNGLAQDPHLADIAAGDGALLKKEETRLTQLIPGALLLRVLREDVDALDESRAPRMGFADLDMVRQALNAPPPPAVHGANTPDVHLALARRLAQGHGVILASLSTKLLENVVAAAAPGSGALQLRQGALELSYHGDPALKTEAPAGEVAIPATHWQIAYWMPAQVDVRGWWFLLVPLIAGALLAACMLMLYRRLERAFHHDMESIAALVKDLMRGKLQGHYPVKIAEGQTLVRQISQLKPLGQEMLQMKDAAEEREEYAAPAPSRPKEQITVEVIPATQKISPAIFRAYDIRGVVGETLTPGVVYEIGRAVGSEAHARGEQRVIIARDGRLSSPELSQALARGLQETGRNVIDIGLAPTPLLYFATHVLNGKSGVMVTGSHNPANYNGLKIVIGGETLAEKDIQQLRLRIENHDFVKGAGKIETRNLIPDYVERIVEDTQIGRPMKIVMDCGNGIAANVAPALLRSLDCEVVELYCEVDGNFPNHHPDPSKPENLQDLIKTVLSEKADLGVAFDGDGDRLGVVDSSGKIIWPDRQMMLFAADVLSRQPGADIIYDVKCTRHLAGQIVKNGGRPLMWKTGHSLIKAKIKETGAMLAGEMSGHIFFKERWYGFDDGIYACARLIEILSGDPRSTAEVFAELPDSLNTPELNVTLAEGENFTFIEKLRALAKFPEARITDIDGLRVDFVDGWGLVRASNTTPSLVIRFEADNEQALARIQGQFKELMKQVKPDIALPF